MYIGLRGKLLRQIIQQGQRLVLLGSANEMFLWHVLNTTCSMSSRACSIGRWPTFFAFVTPRSRLQLLNFDSKSTTRVSFFGELPRLLQTRQFLTLLLPRHRKDVGDILLFKAFFGRGRIFLSMLRQEQFDVLELSCTCAWSSLSAAVIASDMDLASTM